MCTYFNAYFLLEHTHSTSLGCGSQSQACTFTITAEVELEHYLLLLCLVQCVRMHKHTHKSHLPSFPLPLLNIHTHIYTHTRTHTHFNRCTYFYKPFHRNRDTLSNMQLFWGPECFKSYLSLKTGRTVTVRLHIPSAARKPLYSQNEKNQVEQKISHSNNLFYF